MRPAGKTPRWCALALTFSLACGRSPGLSQSAALGSASANPTLGSIAPTNSGLSSLTKQDEALGQLSVHDPERRRRIAQQLARESERDDVAPLLRLLNDDDRATTSWAAYGLGAWCRVSETDILRALVTRSTSLALVQDGTQRLPLSAIALSISRCDGALAEQTLRGWLELGGDFETFAVRGLVRLAERHNRLEDDSLVALLESASRSGPLALLAFDRVKDLGEALKERLSAVADAKSRELHPDRIAAVIALGSATASALPRLATIVADAGFSIAERTAAVRALVKQQGGGSSALNAALSELFGTLVNSDTLERAPWPVLLAGMRLLQHTDATLTQGALRVANLASANETSPAIAQRGTQLRCLLAAARALDLSLGKDLLRCDPEPHSLTGRLAQIEVLDRSHVTGERYREWQSLLAAKEPRVRQAALKLLSSHPELDPAVAPLALALTDSHPGTVATAAFIIAARPERVLLAAAPQPDSSAVAPSIIQALTAALDRVYAPDQVGVRAALFDATAALGLLSLKAHIEVGCRDDNFTLRQRARRALTTLGDRDAVCAAPNAGKSKVESSVALSATRLRFRTSFGEHTITLDPSLAPHSVKRVLDLVSEGFYRGMAIHRAAPGQVVQFGDPSGDGYGGSGRAALKSELGPVHFGALTVGMADSGRDTASSQLFITLVPAPVLDGEYTLIGTASQSWENVVLDDVILDVIVEQSAK